MTEPLTPVAPDQTDYAAVHADIVALLEAARRAAARSVNALMTASYWEIGRRIVEFEQGGQERAVRGQQLQQRLSADLGARFGRGLSVDNLEQMRLFYLAYPPVQISETLSRNGSTAPIAGKSGTVSRNITLEQLAQALPLSWSHYVHLVRRARSAEEREFYEAEALRGGWSVRQLDRQIGSQFYTRALLSKNKRAMLEKGSRPQPGDLVTADEAIKDPYVLEFLNLKGEYSDPPVGLILCARAKSALMPATLERVFVCGVAT